jgi:hypothetical protein
MPEVVTSTPPGSPTPIGPYSHIAERRHSGIIHALAPEV